MKKLTYVLSFVFVAAMGLTTYASNVVVINDTKISIVDQNNDEKPCPADCTCEKCEKAKADAKAEGKEVKCDKSAKKSCCASKKTTKTEEGKVEEKTETTTQQK